ncbi:MAG TPA: hypothetical protein PLM00_01640 [Spirochaetota bacterium]|nr:hypothetical protein [Spirochaetota bacterium]
MPGILVATGELSASNAAATLGPELLRLAPGIRLWALGSRSLETSGFTVLSDPTATASVGHWEALARARNRRRLLRQSLRLILEHAPDLVVCIDSPDFNIPLARAMHRQKTPVLWYIPPQEYLWGATGLARRIGRLASHVFCVDEAAAGLYGGLGIPFTVTGHCLAQPGARPTPAPDRHTGPLIALFPGSRKQEMQRIAPAVIHAAALIARRAPGVRFVLCLADERYRQTIEDLAAARQVPLEIVSREQASHLLTNADLVITKAGTTTMDATFAGCPLVVVYRIHPLTYWIATHILRIQRHLAGISLPNIALGQRAIPELIQQACTPESIATTALAVLADPEPIRKALGRAATLMARPAAASETAQAILKFLPSSLRA